MSSPRIALPIDDFIEELKTLLKDHSNLVITASPGAGKTTRLPPALAELFKGKTRVLEPRRMAAIAATSRIAEENGWTVGNEVGYQVRFSNKTNFATKLIFMTEALLARRLLSDPELEDTDLIILDEFHERSLHVDLALGLLRELQELGRDIRIVVMSATLEAQKIADFLGGCPVVTVPGKLFPLKVHHAKENQVLQTSPLFFDRVCAVVRTAFLNSSRDLLVFLPGVGEIDRVQRLLEDWANAQKAQISVLHGSLKIEEQRDVLRSSPQRRIILTTNIAESSVTVDGVDTVVDTGLSKTLRQDPKTGFSRLELGRISLASAIQRAGRAARQYPGQVYRLWTTHEELNFLKSDVPEIQRADLSESLLFLSAQGVSQFETFQWFEKPPIAHLSQAQNFLKAADALTSESPKNQLTPLGRQLLNFPLPVRLSKVIVSGLQIDQLHLASIVAALLQERDLLKKNQSQDYLGDQFESDLLPRIDILEHFMESKRKLNGFSYHLLQTLDQSVRQIEESARGLKIDSRPLIGSPLDFLLLSAFADRLCRRRGQTDRGLMVGRRGVKLAADSLVRLSEFFIAVQGVEGASDAETGVSLAHGLKKDFVFEYFAEKIKVHRELIYNEERAQFYLQECRYLNDLPLEEAKLSPASAQDVVNRLPEVLAQRFDAVLKENESLQSWWQRLKFLLSHDSEAESDLNSKLHVLTLEAFQQAALGESNFGKVVAKDLVYFFQTVFPEKIVKTIQEQLPDKIKVPSGSLIKIHYPLDKPPFIEVRIQEVFGLVQTPKVLNGTIPLTFHLLGPNFRPVQLTSNLESFWKKGYPEVRKELRLRYPKHQWPEDPSLGVPEARGKRRF